MVGDIFLFAFISTNWIWKTFEWGREEKKTETELYRSGKKRKYSMNEQSISSTIFNNEEIQLLENDYDRCTFF
jgi:hypothetical protein